MSLEAYWLPESFWPLRPYCSFRMHWLQTHTVVYPPICILQSVLVAHMQYATGHAKTVSIFYLGFSLSLFRCMSVSPRELNWPM